MEDCDGRLWLLGHLLLKQLHVEIAIADVSIRRMSGDRTTPVIGITTFGRITPQSYSPKLVQWSFDCLRKPIYDSLGLRLLEMHQDDKPVTCQAMFYLLPGQFRILTPLSQPLQPLCSSLDGANISCIQRGSESLHPVKTA